ncbi:Spo0E family sporulation regulatory protein-aspartic acid phosphatase [Bacillus aerolatus]|uniref:Spo0E family sporulation regulatory protein-aspartic acid phosphatase n=1 Tax=Bacillus aerolatus TaxID=2653354 RepID=A0A6I1FJL9_9BACI|nr:aspartyl-phosphate phosphatase Spo0E family protein [Bacillus aerolatus]KAB7706718.1 Spo0E family sporulation regulatory protein-aspartic acid phosphatase [Bacillus aerolatus]
MLLSEFMFIKKSISEHREDMYRLAKSKGPNHPEVLKASKQLDEQIITFQQMLMASQSKGNKDIS